MDHHEVWILHVEVYYGVCKTECWFSGGSHVPTTVPDQDNMWVMHPHVQLMQPLQMFADTLDEHLDEVKSGQQSTAPAHYQPDTYLLYV